MFVPSFRIVMATPGRTAPLPSRTVPTIAPVLACPDSETGSNSSIETNARAPHATGRANRDRVVAVILRLRCAPRADVSAGMSDLAARDRQHATAVHEARDGI